MLTSFATDKISEEAIELMVRRAQKALGISLDLLQGSPVNLMPQDYEPFLQGQLEAGSKIDKYLLRVVKVFRQRQLRGKFVHRHKGQIRQRFKGVKRIKSVKILSVVKDISFK